ncbi:MAG: glycoside hydrolase family 5 protein [Planctomycetota bacterium]
MRIAVAAGLLATAGLLGCDGPASLGGDGVSYELTEADAAAFEANRRLGHGINLGNALEAPREGDWGYRIERVHLKVIKRLGFDSVRVPVRWSAHIGPGPDYLIEEAFATRVDEVIDWASAEGLSVVLNDHHHGSVIDDPDRHGPELIALWRQLAGRYRDRSPGLVYELLNEPHGGLTAAKWNRLMADALATVRAVDPDRVAIVGPTQWNSIDRLDDLVLPADDRRLIVTVHYYEPFEFTHQGASWVDGSDEWLGTKFSGQGSAARQIARDLGRAAAWGRRQGRPIYVGEFGAYEKGDMPSRAAWTRAVCRAIDESGFSRAYWEFGSGFGIYDPTTATLRRPLVEALKSSER